MEILAKELQYVVDNEGNRLAVIIPIEKWNEILALYPQFEEKYGTPKPGNGLIGDQED